MSKSAPLIELQQATVHRDGTDILHEADWRLEPGKHWAVLGPNGSGKTTLIRVACGYVWPTSGKVLRLGEELVDLMHLRRSIGWVVADMAAQIPPEEPALQTVVSGKFGQLGLRWFHDESPAEEDFAVARELLKAMHCESLADKPFGVLSQGERQQTLVARARMTNPMLVVLDEPCAGMDPGVRERFLAWLEEIASAPKSPTLVFVTHHVEEIMPSFESTLLMKEGTILAAGPTDEVITAKRLEALYGIGVEKMESLAGRRWVVWRRN